MERQNTGQLSPYPISLLDLVNGEACCFRFSAGPQGLKDLAKGVTAWPYPELRGVRPVLSEA